MQSAPLLAEKAEPQLKFASKKIKVFDLGLIDFKKAYDFQKHIFAEVKNAKYNFAVIVCQHYPVITIGRSGEMSDILEKRIETHYIERGGRSTYHGPGQLILYPIFNLGFLKRDIEQYLRWLEALIIQLFTAFGIDSSRRKGLSGVWVNEKKIASLGIAIKNWITFHGLSINVKKESLSGFSSIRPCGMEIAMTSMEDVLGFSVSLEEVKKRIILILKKETRQWQKSYYPNWAKG